MLTWCAAAARAIRGIRAEVIHVHLPPLIRQGTVMTCHHLARSAHEHGVRSRGHGVRGAVREAEERSRLALDDLCYRRRRPATVMAFVSALLRDEFAALYGPPHVGEVLFPPAPAFQPVPPAERADRRRALGLSRDRFVVGYLGGDDPRKGFADVLSLAPERDIALVLAGPHLERTVVDGATVIGYVEPDRVIAACDVVVAPALFEAAGLVVGQALARGVPVVVRPANGWASAVVRCGAGVVWDGSMPLRDAVRAAGRCAPDACRAAAAEVSEDRQGQRLLSLYQRTRTASP
jgi:glycosyltransferase involved in cell wall biosynthesis